MQPRPPAPADAERIYRSLFESYPDALLLVDPEGRIVLANPAAERLLGYSGAALARLPVDALVPDAVRPRHAQFRAAYGGSPKPRPMGTAELVARRCDGTEVMVEIALSPLQDLGLPYVVAAIRAVADYPRVQRALRRARYSEALAHIGQLAVDARPPELVLERLPHVAVDALEADVAVLFLLEPGRTEFRVAAGVGLLEIERVGARVPNRPDTPCGFVLHSGAPVVVESYAEERRFAVPRAYLDAGLQSALGVPLVDRGEPIGALAVRSRRRDRFDQEEIHFLQSLANLIAASLQRARSEEALRHAARLDSVGQLTGGVAHDFNNLLTIIKGNLQVLEELPPLAADENAQQILAAASRAVRRGAELTGKLLAFSRRQVLAPSRVDAAALLESLAGMLRRTLDQRIAIAVEVAPDAPPVVADAGQLEAALLNVAINARDAMPAGGTIAFRCAPARLPQDVAAEVARDAGPEAGERRYVEIAVADDGLGMPDEVRARAFEPFFTTKDPGRGTGLGLSTVYGFVKQSKGAVRLVSTAGAGTVLKLYLPAAEGEERAADAASATVATLPPGLRVLLVEDEPEVRRVVRRLLQGLGATVTEFSNAEEAAASLEAVADYDLLLTDIALGPGRRGTELAAEVLARVPGAAALLMSGYASDLLETGPAMATPWEVLRKPFEREALARAVARALTARPR